MASAFPEDDASCLPDAMLPSIAKLEPDPDLHPAILRSRVADKGRIDRPCFRERSIVENNDKLHRAEASMQLLECISADESAHHVCEERITDEGFSADMDNSRQRALQQQFLKAKHEAETKAKAEQLDSSKRRVERPVAGEKTSHTVKQWMTPEDYRALGYPEYDAKFKDKEYIAEQVKLEMVDPRVNPNLLLTSDDQEFWNNAMRKPFHKQMMRSEDCWNTRRKVWIKQYENVQHDNLSREVAAEFLEECSTHTRRLVTPILRYKIVEKTLQNLLEQAADREGSALENFRTLIEGPNAQNILKSMRDRIDARGETAANEMWDLYDTCWETFIQERFDAQVEQKRKESQVADIDTLAQVLNWGEKCKKDGMLEWEKGNWTDAYMSWKQADGALRRFRAPESNESDNVTIDTLHVSVLKNLALVCIKLERWLEALDAADMAIVCDDQDHKAWFRRACALEGLGRILEAKACLDKIDEIAVGRIDKCRILKDTQAKRDRYQFIMDKDKITNQIMAAQAIEREVFSCNRESGICETPSQVLQDCSNTEHSEGKRCKHLTRDGVEDLLNDLKAAYSDTCFQKQVFKLSRDVKKDRTEFLRHLPSVALPVLQALMDRWGLEASHQGFQEMTHAIEEHTNRDATCAKLQNLYKEVKRALYGVMYSIICREDDGDRYVPSVEVRLNGSKDDDIIDVDD